MTHRSLVPAWSSSATGRRSAGVAVLFFLVAAGCPFLAATGCSRQEGWSYTLSPGIYRLGRSLCVSTMAPPAYPDAARKLALFDFEDITAHTLKVTYPDTLETFVSPTCTLSIARTLGRNFDGVFSLRHDRRYTFSPEGCHLRLRFDDVDYSVGRDTSNAFVDLQDLAEEVTFAVVDHEKGQALTTLDRDDYQQLWKAHGCGSVDRLIQPFERLPDDA